MADALPRDRGDTIPNANSPQLLTHMLEMVARGVRSTRGLEESLGVDQRTVRYYLQAGSWLGLLVDDTDPLLSADGLAYVYAGADRRRIYARAVFDQPFVRGLLQGGDRQLPTAERIAAEIMAQQPELAESTARRRASSVRGLIAPALDPRLVPEAPAREQLSLPLAQATVAAPTAAFTRSGGRSFNPDIYRYLLCAVLDQGEITLGHVRGMLDRAGASDVPIGAYVDLALERADVVKLDERLVVAPGAIARRELAESTASIILSDGGWRAHMESVRTAVKGGGTSIRVSGRYRLWDTRLFGSALSPERLDADLARVLRDRSLAAHPCTTDHPASAPATPAGPFVRHWTVPGLIVALPPTLAQLWEGVGAVNRRLRNARHRADAVGPPTPAYRPVAVHGGLLHPGESLPRSVPDARSLRHRLVRHSPYVTLLTGLLLLHRARPQELDLMNERGRWMVRRHRRKLGYLLEVLDAFAHSRGWLTSRRLHGALDGSVLVGILTHLGLIHTTDTRAVLDEGFFHRLRHDEEVALHAQIEPISAAIADWLESLPAAETTRR